MIVYLIKDGPNTLISINNKGNVIRNTSFPVYLVKINTFSFRAFHKKEFEAFMVNKVAYLDWGILKLII